MGKHPLIVLTVVSLAGTARAAAPVDPSFDLVFQDCKDAPLGTAAFSRALAVELGNSANASGSQNTPQITVTLSCDGVATIRITIGQSSEEREIRLDDVPVDEQPRALALVVAELVQSRRRAGVDPPSSESAPGSPPPGPPPSAETRAASARAQGAPPGLDSSEPPNVGSTEHGKMRLGYWCGAGARLSIGVGSRSYGGLVGVSRGAYRVQGDALFSHARVSRGSINSGLAAVRLRRALPLVTAAHVELELDVSGALGAGWALGSSDVPGTVVKRVLAPYADARLGAAVVLASIPDFAPGLELYVGRAAGMVSRVDGVATLAVGGWFAGLEAGLRL